MDVGLRNVPYIITCVVIIQRFFMKLFGTNNIKVITECQTYFSFKVPCTLLAERVEKLKDDYELQGHGGW